MRTALIIAVVFGLLGCYRPTVHFDKAVETMFATTPCVCGCAVCPASAKGD